MTANWTGNTINVTWYDGDTEYDSNQCTYGGELDVPTAPTKTGYTFKGWRVKPAQCSFASQVCSLTGSAVNGLTYNTNDSTAHGWYSHNGRSKRNESTYGLTAGGWAVKDTNGGIVKGIASCNNTMPTIYNTVNAGMSNGTMTSEQAMNTLWGSCESDAIKPGNTFSSSSTGQYCWCKMESYTPSGGSACNIASPSWVFIGADSVSGCAFLCVNDCASYVMNRAGFRRAVFGVAQ